jgi:hypothetical protein
MVGEYRANVSSPGKMVGECRASVSSPANFPKWPFWRVLEFAKTGEFLASTQIRQNWRIFGEYSNSTNSPASGHCLGEIRFVLFRSVCLFLLYVSFSFYSSSFVLFAFWIYSFIWSVCFFFISIALCCSLFLFVLCVSSLFYSFCFVLFAFLICSFICSISFFFVSIVLFCLFIHYLHFLVIFFFLFCFLRIFLICLFLRFVYFFQFVCNFLLFSFILVLFCSSFHFWTPVTFVFPYFDEAKNENKREEIRFSNN